MAREISLNKTYGSYRDFMAAVKDAAISIPEGTFRVHTWYNNSCGNIPHTCVTLQEKLQTLPFGGVVVNSMSHGEFDNEAVSLIEAALEELRNSGIYVYPKIKETWQA